MPDIDYSKTVNLPATGFPMKANLAQNEPKWLSFWRENDVYRRMLERCSGGEPFILHDGPPYANGRIHIGHALNKVLKDFTVKRAMLCGRPAPYVPGWDCHGLPIEYQLFKDLNISKDQISRVEFRRMARAYAARYVDIQREEFRRLGVFGDWDRPYLTMDPSYERQVMRCLRDLVAGGYVYRSRKPVHWCVHCETSLAEAEIEYADKSSDSVYVAFPVARPSPALAAAAGRDVADLVVLIWTTTPWTLPANQALAFKPDGQYVIVHRQNGRGRLLLMKNMLPVVRERLGEELPVVAELSGGDIATGDPATTTRCRHPFIDRESPALGDDMVSTDDGTGVVHIAPGHGEEDYRLGLRAGLEVYSPVDVYGRYDDAVTVHGEDLRGVRVFEANRRIIERMTASGTMLWSGTAEHSYPHCWRCKKPVIFRATEQWFLDVDHGGLRERMLENIGSVSWVPEYGRNRIAAMVAQRPDWCLSRQRYWGAPIPAVRCTACGEVSLTVELVERAAHIFGEEGSDAWFTRDLGDFLPADFACPKCGARRFDRENDILDVWYDSAVSYETVPEVRAHLGRAMYLEGSDQHRGWFQVALIVSSAIHGKPPYATVLTHGFVVDGAGRKMSKSQGNVVAPQDIIARSGADIVRLWVASSDYTEDVRISPEILAQLTETYRKVRNTLRFLLGNLGTFPRERWLDLGSGAVLERQLDPLDRYALGALTRLAADVDEAYGTHRYYRVIALLNEFCVSTLSGFYLDVIKGKLYTYRVDDPRRVATLNVLHLVLRTLLQLLAPILSFTAEEAWQAAREQGLVDAESVFLTDWRETVALLDRVRHVLDAVHPGTVSEFDALRELRCMVNVHLEELRKLGKIGSSLEAEVTLECYDNAPGRVAQKLDTNGVLKTALNVSGVHVRFHPHTKPDNLFPTVSAKPFNGLKCPRCWMFFRELENSGICATCADALRARP
jgi:isoleucyl-tRNA synthetase